MTIFNLFRCVLPFRFPVLAKIDGNVISKKKDKSLEARSEKPQICLDPRQTSNRSTQRIFTHTDSEIITDILMMMIN